MLTTQKACGSHKPSGKSQPVLPYGDTLHYVDCGCPELPPKQPRAADLLDALFCQAFDRYQQRLLIPCRYLTIAYMLPHHNVVSWSCCESLHVKLSRLALFLNLFMNM